MLSPGLDGWLAGRMVAGWLAGWMAGIDGWLAGMKRSWRSGSDRMEVVGATGSYCAERELVAGVGFAQSPHNSYFFCVEPAHNK